MSAIGPGGTSGPSNEASATSSPQVAPTGLTATAEGRTRIDLAWTAPDVAAADAPTGYKVEVSPGGHDGTWTDLVTDTGGTGTTYKHTGLTAGTTRHYRVSAIGPGGTSGPSNEESATTTAAGTPGAPTGLTARSAGKTQILLSWKAPNDTGGIALTGYRIEVSPSGATGTWTALEPDTGSTATTFVHAGLTASTTRHYRVFAINAVGTGDPSNVTSAATVDVGEASVDDLTATAIGPTQIDLAWTAPSLGGSFSADGYEIDVSTNWADGTWTTLVSDTGSAATKYSHTGLTAGTTRYYRLSGMYVRAFSDEAAILSSNVASATTIGTAPDAPTGLTATPIGLTQIDLAWTAPTATGREEITGYKIEVSPKIGTPEWKTLESDTGNTETTYSDTGLTTGTTRYYRVSAINAIGTSRPSNVATARAGDAPPPDPPTGLTAKPAASGEVALSWTAPAVADVTITEYFVQYESDSLVDLAEFNTGSTDTAFTVTGLRPGTTYTFHVRAVLSDGKASPAATATAATPAATGKPGKPAGLTARALSPTHVTLSWTPAAGQGVTGYRIDHSPNGVDQWKTAESDTGTTHPGYDHLGLAPGTTYHYRVLGGNPQAGTGPWSDVAHATTPVHEAIAFLYEVGDRMFGTGERFVLIMPEAYGPGGNPPHGPYDCQISRR